MSDDITDDELCSRVPLTRGAEIAHLLGRIEVTLKDMRLDIQSGNLAQTEFAKQLLLLDRRVLQLEGKEGARKMISRAVAVVALAVLIPAVNAADQLHDWFSSVDKFCFPKGKP
jgi:hypothetical protein